MNTDDINKFSAELIAMLTHTSAALTTFQGLELGFFDKISPDKPITARELSGQTGYDFSLLERWLRFSVANGYLHEAESGYTLTPKGTLLSRNTHAPDLVGLHHMVSFFARTVQHSRDIYQKGVGLDSITKDNISRDYIPRVASQLSRAAAVFFKQSGLSVGHTLLDLGCRDGSVLRESVKACPGVSATGIDSDAIALETGRQKNIEAGLQDQIDLQVGDMKDLSRFKDNSFDWICAINVFHFLPLNKREKFLGEMIRISRYGMFTNQVIANTLGTLAVDVLLATLFTDYTGFFTPTDADAILEKSGIRHYSFLPIIQGESRLVVLFTSRNDVPIKRIATVSESEKESLAALSIHTAKDLLTADRKSVKESHVDIETARSAAIKLLFP